MTEGIEKRKRSSSRKTLIDKEDGTMCGIRKIKKARGAGQGGYYVFIPWEFVERHNLKEGDPLPFVSDHVLKFIPVKEE